MRQRAQNVSPMSNEGRNLYVVEHITAALLELLEDRDLGDISIGALCDQAGVGRASFYRNFTGKEDVLARELKRRLDAWWLEAIVQPDFDFTRALFQHFYDERAVYLLLYRRGLAHLNLGSIKDSCGPKPGQSNLEAYKAAFLAYGLYGWIEEWFARGMAETPAEMAALLAQANGSPPQKE